MSLFTRDLHVVLLLTALTLAAVFTPPLSSTPLRVIFGLPFVLFLPGYALIAALFPGKGDLDGIERVALSFGLSIAVVPLIGLILNYTPFGIRLVPIAVSLSIFTASLTIAAYFRRKGLGEGDRFTVHLDLRNRIRFEGETGIDKVLSILLVISIVAALLALVFVISTPKQGERFTEFYILGEGGKAADYPTDLILGDVAVVRVGVVNHEFESANYTLKVALENSTLISDSLTLHHNGTWMEDVSFVPGKKGTALKLEFLLYKNDGLEPYRDLHLWVDVR
jgi:uncharacterized membrane protein